VSRGEIEMSSIVETVFGLIHADADDPLGVALVVDADVAVGVEHETDFVASEMTVRFAHDDVLAVSFQVAAAAAVGWAHAGGQHRRPDELAADDRHHVLIRLDDLHLVACLALDHLVAQHSATHHEFAEAEMFLATGRFPARRASSAAEMFRWFPTAAAVVVVVVVADEGIRMFAWYGRQMLPQHVNAILFNCFFPPLLLLLLLFFCFLLLPCFVFLLLRCCLGPGVVVVAVVAVAAVVVVVVVVGMAVVVVVGLKMSR